MPDDCRNAGHDGGSYKIEIVLNPTDQHVIKCNGNKTMAADAPLHTDEETEDDNDEKDVHVNAVLWRSGTLATWPAIDLNVLIQQTITRCTNPLNGKQKIKTAVCKHTDSVDSNNSVNAYPRIDRLLTNSKEIIL